MKQEKIEEICTKIQELFAQTPLSDIRKNLRTILLNNLSDMDLVTREEFDVQTTVLNRAKEKLILLEKRIDQLNSQSVSSRGK